MPIPAAPLSTPVVSEANVALLPFLLCDDDCPPRRSRKATLDVGSKWTLEVWDRVGEGGTDVVVVVV